MEIVLNIRPESFSFLKYLGVYDILMVKKFTGDLFVMEKKKILLHVCCAPCSPYVADLLSEDYEVTLFFYNPNIQPKPEYELRLEEIKRFAEENNLKLIIGDYDLDKWTDYIKGLETEPERGKRCDQCFRLRLEKSIKIAEKKAIPYLTTTLTVSPHKDANTINRIGKELSENSKVDFLAENFKKNDGFKKTNLMGEKYNFYRQNYCGCIFSRRK